MNPTGFEGGARHHPVGSYSPGNMPEHVRITDVAPRDGLQNEAGFVPTERKAALVRALAASGVDEVEVTSFVSPRWVPQLGDAAELCGILSADKPTGIIYSSLVPNERGMETLLEVNQAAGRRLIDKVSVFTAASETFSQKNTNASISETIDRFRRVIAMAKEGGLVTRGYVSCIVDCPFEGPVEPFTVASVAGRLADLGVDEIDLGDTTGTGTPESIGRVTSTALQYLDESHDWSDASKFTLHLHDTHGRAAGCVRVALELGVRSFDGAAGGLGGCPFASTEHARAPGNISTATLLDAIEAAGLIHGVDRARHAAASDLAESVRAEAGPREAPA